MTGIEETIIHTPHADYHFRITVNRQELEAIFETLEGTIDYENFKGKIGNVKGQRDKLNAYHGIWNLMYQYQNKQKFLDLTFGENYCDEYEEVIGYSPSNRSMRCIFDPGATEWNDLKYEDKLQTLTALIKHRPLLYWVNSYANYYANEINKGYVVREIPGVLKGYFEAADEELKKSIKPLLSIRNFNM